MASFARGITFATNGTVTAENLHNLIDQTTPRAGIITDRSVLTTMSTGDRVLIADTDDATNAYFITAGSLVGQALSGATYGGASFTAGTIATLNSTTGTFTNLTSSTATISTLAGNTTGGTFSGNIVATAGTVTTLTASTASITSLPGAVSGGTYSGNVIATAGTVTTFNSTTGTITNLSTTLVGDFTISQGTATLGTTGVTAGTYGTNTAAVTLTLDAKGRITTVSTSEISTTPANGSITYAKLSTSGTESDNVAKRTAKAWVSFNGTGTVAINDDFNVSSITDNGTGSYGVNFSNAMADANYCAIPYSSRGLSQNNREAMQSTKGTSSYSFETRWFNAGVNSAAGEDMEFIHVLIFGA